MTTSKFPQSVVHEMLTKSGRRCCLCHEFKGPRVEVHHVTPKAEGGDGAAANAIVLCFDCHSDVHAYWSNNPKGRKFSASELRKRREDWFRKFDAPASAPIDYGQLAGELLQQLAGRFRQGAEASLPTKELSQAANEASQELLEEAVGLQERYRYREAIDCLKEAYRRRLSPEAKIELCLMIGHNAVGLGDFDEAHRNFSQALALGQKTRNRKVEVFALDGLGMVAEERGDLRSAQEMFLAALEICRGTGDKRGEATQLGELGNTYLKKGFIRKAVQHYRSANKIHRSLGDKAGLAADTHNLAIAEMSTGHLGRAVEALLERLGLATVEKDYYHAASAHCELGEAFRHLGQLCQAMEHYDKAHTIFRKIGSKIGQLASLKGRAIVQAETGDLLGARRTLKKVLALAAQIGALRAVASALGALGLVTFRLGKPEPAEDYICQALSLFVECDDIGGITTEQSNLGLLYASCGLTELGEELNRTALELSRKAGDKLEEARILVALGIIGKMRGHKRRAYLRFCKAREICHSLGIGGVQTEIIQTNIEELGRGERKRVRPQEA